MMPYIAWAALATASALAPTPGGCAVALSLDGQWMLAPDPGNAGRDEAWWTAPREGARPTPVPWIIQEVLPGYHGVAWYWESFPAPVNPHADGRALLHFWAVDYACDVYLNGTHVGSHEGGEEPFDLDVTEALAADGENLLAVRVLNPTYEPIDGISLPQTPHRNKTHPYSPGSDFNYGGITDSVELRLVPQARIDDLFVRSDPATGLIAATVEAHNAGEAPVEASLTLSAGPASEGSTLAVETTTVTLPPGVATVPIALSVDRPRLWDLSDPFLYRVSARLQAGGSPSFDERSIRTGFRDFRFERGAFRLNGRRIYLLGSHTGADSPVGVRVPYDLDLVRRDLLNSKAMGLNMIRFIAGVARRAQLDLADELGLLVYEENFASWGLADSPRMPELFDDSTRAMIRRDRNHPSIVMWGVLNECGLDAIFHHAVDSLPTVLAEDDTRVVMLNSGRFDMLTDRTRGAGLEGWRPAGQLVPSVIRNAGTSPGHIADSTWQPNELALHPGLKGERSVARWTAPRNDNYRVTARFTGIAAKPTTSDAHILMGVDEVWSGGVNIGGAGNVAEAELTAYRAAGETLSFVVGIGDGSPFSDTTAISITIEAVGYRSVASGSLRTDANPAGDWAWGWMPGDEPLRDAPFIPYDRASALGGAIGSLANPGVSEWQDILSDQHPYQHVPHTAGVIATLRGLSGQGRPVFVSEYGIGSAVDLCRMARHYEALGKTECEDALAYRRALDAFLADWERWRLDEAFASPEDYFRQCLSKMGRLRAEGIDALRANPEVVAYSLTGTQDQALTGEGLWSTFRELKPGTADALFEAYAPLRMCVFATPRNAWSGGEVRVEAVLSNIDILGPGDYPVRFRVVRPDGTRAVDESVTLTIPTPAEGEELPFALPVLDRAVTLTGPAGRYRVLVTLERGGAATGGETSVALYEPATPAAASVVRFGSDPELDAWLAAEGIATIPLAEAPVGASPILLAGSGPSDPAEWEGLFERVRAGATASVLTVETLRRGEEQLGWLPLDPRPALGNIWGWLYLRDEWAKRHPLFDGLPAGGLMDYDVYAELIPDTVIQGPTPAEAIAGAVKTSQGYDAGLFLASYPLGEGRVVLNVLPLREHLATHPVAAQLVRNMVR